ncbi:hypothetical protein SDC9_151444 [bioreactor metagenome]|uniref:Uncharacterized protein n=1 Tax=bioreactor metagenome TaxID=1076179 RepID=A0A645EQB1_9ZZZZ
MGIDGDAPLLENALELDGSRLLIKAGDDHLGHLQPPLGKVVDHLEDIGIIGDTEVTAHLAPLDIAAMDADDDIYLVLE